MLSLILRDFAQEHKTLIHVFVLLSVFLFSTSFIVYCICSLEVSGNLNSSGAGKLFVSIVVSARIARSLSLFVVFKTSGTVSLFSLYFRGFVNQLNQISCQSLKKIYLNKSHWTRWFSSIPFFFSS